MAINTAEVIANVALAWGAGSLIGLERTFNGRVAGFRTHALVSVAAATAMTAVAIQPTTRSVTGRQKRPMVALLVDINIIMTITGTATTPLMTALQNSALIGSMGVKFSSAPRIISRARMA